MVYHYLLPVTFDLKLPSVPILISTLLLSFCLLSSLFITLFLVLVLFLTQFHDHLYFGKGIQYMFIFIEKLICLVLFSSYFVYSIHYTFFTCCWLSKNFFPVNLEIFMCFYITQ